MAVSTSAVAGIVSGRNPLEYSALSPYTLFLFQAVLIIVVCHVIHYPLGKLQQPRVIAEVITGIILGPSVMGHVPGFTSNCFPQASISGLTLFANIGIILFLFIVGLEVDIGFIKKNFRVAMSVGLINMAVPFGLGCAISVGIYNQYHDASNAAVSFTTYMTFIAVAMCITAFPVLARILTELNLIGDRVGVIVLAAGIANDLTGWILLALVVVLANASSGVKTVYILLLTAGWFLFLCYPVRIAMKFIIRRFTNDLSTGEPSQLSMVVILLTVFVSAFFTDIIGVHPIFGAFMAGVIVPRDNGYVVKITEKLEDLVHIVLIPLYFALAGLAVNLGLLNTGIDWGYTIGILCLAMVGKVSGGFVAAKLNGLLWTESLAVGVLMSCKGIVEIVVLNVGLNARIISQKVYSMFVVMALVTTFLTTPLALWVYPVSYREKRDKFIKGEINWDGTHVTAEQLSDGDSYHSRLVDENGPHIIPLSEYEIKDLPQYRLSKIVLLLKKIDTISYLMAFIKTFNDPVSTDIKAIHLREFSSRTSHLIEASSSSAYEDEEKVVNASNQFEYNNSSSILSIVKSFADILGMTCTSRSILSTFKNHIFSINEQIAAPTEFLITTIKLNQLSNDFYDSLLYKQLFQQSECHFGLLLINDRPLEDADHETKNSSAYTESIQELPRGLISFKTISLVFNSDNVLSSNDLLSLHLVYRLLARQGHCQVNVFVKSSPSAHSAGFEKEITSFLTSKNSKLVVKVHSVTDNLEASIKKYSHNLVNELFIIANNSVTPKSELRVSTPTNESLFENDINQLLNLSVAESFHVLIVKASSH
ncbi:K(+)/H(+) antiporter [Suhomyces tanzawaensis NRRL Y-17324]|uniref:K(+)/H(+) antiporter n=1 Tax=Suhomyces tanzawaensis NRRL Y-17324 TaxID=984487 RepID=A0A1E4SCZ8_9ASCO|nr:K(+)/H(+) antiporter [Suhomyces tanzawaensis NRRL Y-17324]ODV77375.1 K(+)/H(+) antiporter [Suhomyces tanzawaensis NRRL Y-17324]